MASRNIPLTSSKIVARVLALAAGGSVCPWPDPSQYSTPVLHGLPTSKYVVDTKVVEADRCRPASLAGSLCAIPAACGQLREPRGQASGLSRPSLLSTAALCWSPTASHPIQGTA